MNVIPDKITPEIGWRSWNVENGVLHSTNQVTAWPLGRALEAECDHPPEQRYVPRRYGRVRAIGCTEQRVAQAMGGSVTVHRVFLFEAGELGVLDKEPPYVQLPPSWGYELEEAPKEIPGDQCSCGIYALNNKEEALRSPYFASTHGAIGAVNLWGKIIPGERGFRAQFAYPLFIYTNENLLDYGVPVRPLSDLGINLPRPRPNVLPGARRKR